MSNDVYKTVKNYRSDVKIRGMFLKPSRASLVISSKWTTGIHLNENPGSASKDEIGQAVCCFHNKPLLKTNEGNAYDTNHSRVCFKCLFT